MNKEQLKTYLCDLIDTMDEDDVEEFEQYLNKQTQEERMAAELVSIKGELKKMTKLLQDSGSRPQRETLPFIDFYRFMKNAEESLIHMRQPTLFTLSAFNESFSAFRSGFHSIGAMYDKLLDEVDLYPTAKKGERFNADLHEAIERVEDETQESGTITEVVVQGFIYQGKLIDYAKVKVNR